MSYEQMRFRNNFKNNKINCNYKKNIYLIYKRIFKVIF